MKLAPSNLEFFISPITGKLYHHTILPSLVEDYVWEGDATGEPKPSPVLIDMRLFSSQTKNQLDNVASSAFILKTANSQYVPNSQALDTVANGVMINTGGVISTSNDYVKFAGTGVVDGNIAIFSGTDGKTIEDGGISIPELEEFVEEAKEYAEEAHTYANQAKASADAAHESELSAEASSSTATAKAAAAAASATLAEAAKVEAEAYATSAGEFSAAAFASAGLAAGSATNAADSASHASDSADTATAASHVAGERRDEAAASATSAQNSLNTLLATGIHLTGAITGDGTFNAPVTTSINFFLDEVPPPQNDVSLNTNKITFLANGVDPADAVNMSQLTSAIGGTVASVSGTTNRITSTGGTNPVIDISSSYVGQSSITTLGTITTGTWNASIIALNKGGTNANLTASNGGIFYSTASAGAILAGTAIQNQILVSGASGAPSWVSRIIDYGDSGPNIGSFFIGHECGNNNLTNAPWNTGIGHECLNNIDSSPGPGPADFNTGIGYKCLNSLTRGRANTANGAYAGHMITTASENCGTGAAVLSSNSTTNANTATGFQAFLSLNAGSGKNTASGWKAGSNHINYTQCTFLGAESDASAESLVNATAVGYGAVVDESNCMQLGNSSLEKIKTNARLQFSQVAVNRKIVLYESVNNDNEFYGFGVNNNVLRHQVSSTSGNHVFYAAANSSSSNELMRITGAGRVGIGTSNPTTAKLVVSGGVQNIANEESCFRVISATNFAKIELHNTNPGGGRLWEIRSSSSATFDIVDRSAVAQRFQITSTGNVGIGAFPDQLLTVNSSTPSKISAGSWAAFSDARIKDVVGDYKQGLAEIIKIKTRMFKYNAKSEYPEHEREKVHIGVIAQEIEDIFPECITEKVKKGRLKDVRVYDGSALTYALINAVKELNEKVERLESAA